MVSRRKFDVDRVIDQCVEVFWRKGYHATSISDLTAATGVNRKCLYLEFGDKEALFAVALERYHAHRMAQVGWFLTREPLRGENVRDFLDALCDAFEDKGCLFGLTVSGVDSTPELARVKARAALEGLREAMERNFAADPRYQDGAERRADIVFAATNGLAVMSRAGEGAPRLKRLAADAYCSAVNVRFADERQCVMKAIA